MKQPINQKTEVLHSLIESDKTTLQLVRLGVCNPTSVITILRRCGADILCDSIVTKNRYGRKISYGKFRLGNKKMATKLYNQLTKSK